MYLITPSLYNSYYWYTHLENSSKSDFLNVLNKVQTEPNELIKRGIEFEDKIRAASEKGEVTGDNVVDQIVFTIRGGVWQKSCKKELDGNLLYGRMDVYTPEKIYDIKYSKNYDLMKYKYSIQHMLYMYCTGVRYCDYLVSDGEELDIESYNYDENLEPLLKTRINEMLDFIFAFAEFREPYEEHWEAK